MYARLILLPILYVGVISHLSTDTFLAPFPASHEQASCMYRTVAFHLSKQAAPDESRFRSMSIIRYPLHMYSTSFIA